MTSDIIMGIVIAILVLLSAFFSATETAFSFVNKIRIQHSVDNGNKKAKNALYVIENFDNALTTILICNNIVNLSCSSIATVLCLNLFGDMGSAIATGATTLLVLTFGEVTPKLLRSTATLLHSRQPAYCVCLCSYSNRLCLCS